VARAVFIVIMIGLGLGTAFAQTDVPTALKDRPPVAAPTSKIEVNPINVVRSLSEQVDDFGSGLIQGLMTGERVHGVAFVAVQENRVIVSKNFGCCIASDPRFGEGFTSDLLVSLAAMQLIERGKLSPEKDRIGQMLTHEIDPSPLRGTIEKASGQDLKTYLQQNILAPLEAESSGERLEMIPRVMGRLMIALLNGGAFDGGQILQSSTVDLMEQPHFSIHPALPGWTYGFAEMRRNGWRALQHDGQWQNSPQAQARFVIVPEAKLGYFVIIDGRAGAQFWHTLDDALFDRILPPRGVAAPDAPQTAPPDNRRASAIAGVYEASDEALSSIAALKIQGRRLNVDATNDGGIVLSGSERAVLAPRPGGYWGAPNGNLNAVESNGRLVLGSGIFRPLRPWKRPELYASFAVLFAIGMGGALYDERRRKCALNFPSDLVLALSAAAIGFLLLSALVWLLAPA
jgi:hypothetical protein